VLRLYVICVAPAAAACRDNEAQQMAKVRDQVCACKQRGCAEAALQGVPKGKVQSTPRSQRIAREMLECLARIYDQDRPTLDIDALAPEASDSPNAKPAPAQPR
jgi:hypothetical protein